MADAFLSYSRADEAVVRRIRERLTEAGLSTFLDRTGLAAGQPWLPWLEQEIGKAKAVVVFIGPSGMGGWQHREVQLAQIREGSEPGFPVIPVLLPGVKDAPTGTFLTLNTWVNHKADENDPEQPQRHR